jgi:hypothetical protein
VRTDGPCADSSGDEAIEGWVLSFAFKTFESAGPVYERARDFIFARDVDASVYRIVLEGHTHVVALGFIRMQPGLERQLEEILSAGEDAMLPEEVLLALSIRHAEVRAPGMKYERRGMQPPNVTFD